MSRVFSFARNLYFVLHDYYIKAGGKKKMSLEKGFVSPPSTSNLRTNCCIFALFNIEIFTVLKLICGQDRYM